MFTRTEHSSEFDSVIVVEGSLKRPDVDGEIIVDLVMMYTNRKTGISYGSCKVTKNLFRKETVELLEQFLAAAEEDFGNIAFGEGTVVTPGGSIKSLGGTAEDLTGKLDPKSLGGG